MSILTLTKTPFKLMNITWMIRYKTHFLMK